MVINFVKTNTGHIDIGLLSEEEITEFINLYAETLRVNYEKRKKELTSNKEAQK